MAAALAGHLGCSERAAALLLVDAGGDSHAAANRYFDQHGGDERRVLGGGRPAPAAGPPPRLPAPAAAPGLMAIDVREINYTQSTVSERFSGDHAHIRLQDTIDAIRAGRMQLSDLPPIRIVRHADTERDPDASPEWWSIDNRRLHVMKEALKGKHGPRIVHVRVVQKEEPKEGSSSGKTYEEDLVNKLTTSWPSDIRRKDGEDAAYPRQGPGKGWYAYDKFQVKKYFSQLSDEQIEDFKQRCPGIDERFQLAVRETRERKDRLADGRAGKGAAPGGQAGDRGDGAAADPAGNPWHQFRAEHRGERLSPQQMSDLYQKQKQAKDSASKQLEERRRRLAADHAATDRPAARAAGAWNPFQKEHRGEGLSPQQMSELYQRQKCEREQGCGQRAEHAASRAVAAPSSRAVNPWNQFQQEHRGLSGQQMSALYQEQKRQQQRPPPRPAPAPAAPPAAAPRAAPRRNPWNEFQQEHGGQALGSAAMRDLYHESRSSHSAFSSGGGGGGGGGGNSWHEFRAAHKGMSMSPQEMSQAYQASKR
eukprot:TRINITY_DN3118_c0_g4_i1.p1 TRINITY_DN3118_c0_g4~~TRINITY_DN3118_c0_g4_i1.p1  ORF type:complete len:536 (+),score=165.70 TRINITY_DN3118_c0_g4_i1:87-1694(+)